MKYIKRYAFKASGLGIILYAITLVLSFSFPDKNIVHEYSWLLIIGVFLISIFAELITLAGILLEKQNLVPFLLGSMITRLLLGLIMLTVLLFLIKNERAVLAINFMAVYLCFMVFEINSSIANLRQFFEKGRDNEEN